ncbi:MAG: RraA family protein [Thermomicrobiales bacterium]
MLDHAERLEALHLAYAAAVSDALDRLGLREQALDPAIRPIHAGAKVVGRAAPTLVVTSEGIPDKPYEGEIRAAEALRPGDVSVIVATGTRAAVWGELFSCAARGRGAVGAIIDGYVRDAQQIAELAYPVFARGCSPLDTLGRAEAREVGVTVSCGGVAIAPGDYLIADGDGAVAIPAAAIDEVLALIRPKLGKERRARADLLAGERISDVWEKYGVL